MAAPNEKKETNDLTNMMYSLFKDYPKSKDKKQPTLGDNVFESQKTPFDGMFSFDKLPSLGQTEQQQQTK